MGEDPMLRHGTEAVGNSFDRGGFGISQSGKVDAQLSATDYGIADPYGVDALESDVAAQQAAGRAQAQSVDLGYNPGRTSMRDPTTEPIGPGIIGAGITPNKSASVGPFDFGKTNTTQGMRPGHLGIDPFNVSTTAHTARPGVSVTGLPAVGPMPPGRPAHVSTPPVDVYTALAMAFGLYGDQAAAGHANAMGGGYMGSPSETSHAATGNYGGTGGIGGDTGGHGGTGGMGGGGMGGGPGNGNDGNGGSQGNGG
jgi:hypothetical protein